MPRPCKLRRVKFNPQAMSFRPGWADRIANVRRAILSRDELEAIRLADFEGLYQGRCGRENENIPANLREHRLFRA